MILKVKHLKNDETLMVIIVIIIVKYNKCSGESNSCPIKTKMFRKPYFLETQNSQKKICRKM